MTDDPLVSPGASGVRFVRVLWGDNANVIRGGRPRRLALDMVALLDGDPDR
jgi:hypothetical protein